MTTAEEIAQNIAAHAAKKPPVVNIDNTALVEEFRRVHKGRILHVRPSNGRRGVTFAFIMKGSRIEFSTAVQHRNDCFTRKQGTRTAIEHFLEGKKVTVPLDGDIYGAEWLLESLARGY